jgi:hypothetical protein
MWPAVIVQQLFFKLPEGYIAAPRVRLAAEFEIDVSTFERGEPVRQGTDDDAGGSIAVAAWAPPEPTLTLVIELPDQDEYEVRIYDTRHRLRLVAALEIVSPSNKDRPESRRAFVAKVSALLQRGVCVSIVDIVTIRQFNLYADLLDLIGRRDPMLGPEPSGIYAVTLQGRKRDRDRPVSRLWYYPMAFGQSLPTLPIWLDADLAIFLDLQSSDESACHVLRIN